MTGFEETSLLASASLGEPYSPQLLLLLASELNGVRPGVRGFRKGDLFVNLKERQCQQQSFGKEKCPYLNSPLFSLICSIFDLIPRTSSKTPALRNLHRSC